MLSFDDFWTAYPKKVAKHDAMKAFARLSLADRIAACAALPLHCAEWRGRGDRKFTPHAATWLRGRRWEDQFPTRNIDAIIDPDWSTECQRVHGGSCGSRYVHALRSET